LKGRTKRLFIALMCSVTNFIYASGACAYDYPYKLPTPDSSWNGQNAYIVNLQPVLKNADDAEKALDVVTSVGLPKWSCNIAKGDSLSFNYTINTDKWLNGVWAEKLLQNVPSALQKFLLGKYLYIRVEGSNGYNSGWQALNSLKSLPIDNSKTYKIFATYDVDGLLELTNKFPLVKIASLAAQTAQILVDLMSITISGEKEEIDSIKEIYAKVAKNAAEVAKIYADIYDMDPYSADDSLQKIASDANNKINEMENKDIIKVALIAFDTWDLAKKAANMFNEIYGSDPYSDFEDAKRAETVISNLCTVVSSFTTQEAEAAAKSAADTVREMLDECGFTHLIINGVIVPDTNKNT